MQAKNNFLLHINLLNCVTCNNIVSSEPLGWNSNPYAFASLVQRIYASASTDLWRYINCCIINDVQHVASMLLRYLDKIIVKKTPL